jgi:phage shock protein C
MSSPAVGPPTTSPPARLVRSRDDRLIAGVAGGIGQHLGIDPIVVRLVFVVLALAGGGGVLAYLIAWVVIPEGTTGAVEPRAGTAASGSVVAGVILVSIGGLMLVDRFVPVATWRYALPALLIVLGVLLLTRKGTEGS